MVKIKTKEWNKLVRDRIPEVIERHGGTVEIEVVTDKKRRVELLKDKLQEEVTEVRECDKDGFLEECGDVLTVLEDLVEEAGFNLEELIEMQAEKDKEKGRFKKGIFLKSTKG